MPFDSTFDSSRRIVSTPNAPAPIGPYNQAVWAGSTLYLSGQVALDADTGRLDNASLEAETRRVMRNIAAVLRAADLDFSDVVKCSIFLKDMNDFAAVNAIYGEFFPASTAPARECVEVARLPRDVRVEISAIAHKTT